MEEEKKVLTLYSNRANVVSGQFEVTLDFGCQIGSEAIQLPRISLSWQHAKMLAKILGQAVADYEKMYETELKLEPNKEIFDIMVKEGKIQVHGKHDGR